MKKIVLTSLLSASILGLFGLTAMAEETSAGEKVQNAINSGASSVAKGAGELTDKTVDMTEDAKDAIANKADDVKDKAADVLDDTKKDVKALSNDLNDKIQDDL